MPKLDKPDWKKLKTDKVAFAAMPQTLFDLLLEKVYTPANPGSDEDVDALMIYLACVTEPPIQPVNL